MHIRKKCARKVYYIFESFLCLIIKEIDSNFCFCNMFLLNMFISYFFKLFYAYNKQRLECIKCKSRNVSHKIDKIGEKSTREKSQTNDIRVN